MKSIQQNVFRKQSLERFKVSNSNIWTKTSTVFIVKSQWGIVESIIDIIQEDNMSKQCFRESMSTFSELDCSPAPRCHFSYLLHLESCHRGSTALREGFSGLGRKSLRLVLNSPVTVSLSWDLRLLSEASISESSDAGKRIAFSQYLGGYQCFFSKVFELPVHKNWNSRGSVDSRFGGIEKIKWRGERFVRAVQCVLCSWRWGNGKRLICCGVRFCFCWQFLHI